jgi:excisionase family DNA binding protein
MHLHLCQLAVSRAHGPKRPNASLCYARNQRDEAGMSITPLKTTYTVPEAATYLSVSQRTVRRLIATGQLEVCRIGRRVVITRQALKRFIRRNSRGYDGL